MIKYLLPVIGIILSVLFGINPNDLTINKENSNNLRTYLSDSEVIIDVSIKNVNNSSYVRYSLNLPEEVYITPINLYGGNIQMFDKTASIEWVDFPQNETVNISYKLQNKATVVFSNYLSPILSYISANERKEKELKPLWLTLSPVSQPDTPSCKRSMAVHAVPGKHLTVTLQVNKKGIGGFAKLQEVLPDGFEAEEINVEGAIFSFEKQKLKLLWMSVPEKDSYMVSYKIIVPEDAYGIYKISGTFSFVNENNETKKINIPYSEIAVSEEIEEFENFIAEQESKIIEEEKTEDNIIQETEDNSKDSTKTDTLVLANNTQENSRQSRIEESEYEVSSEYIDSTHAMEEDSSTGIPEKTDTIGLTEKGIIEETKVEMNEEIASNKNEELSVNPETEDLELTTEENIDNEIIANNEAAATTESQETDTETAIAEEITDAEDTSNIEPEGKINEKELETNLTANIIYRVQISATKRSVDNSYYEKKYSVNEKIYAETHQGWFKYTVGEFPVYKEARDKRENVHEKYNIKGPFVTSYNKGERITVQEALMISNQKWFP